MASIIIQKGDAYQIPISVNVNGSPMDPDDVSGIIFTLGSSEGQTYPGSVIYSEGKFLYPLTSEISNSLPTEEEIRLKLEISFAQGDSITVYSGTTFYVEDDGGEEPEEIKPKTGIGRDIQGIIDYVDAIKPNAYFPEDKVNWLNELEYSIQADVIGRDQSEIIDHVWEAEWSGKGVYFPDRSTIVIPGTIEARAGGMLTIEGLVDYAANNITAQVESVGVRGAETVIRFPAGTFPAVGSEPESGSANVTYDGKTELMIAPFFWHKIYYSYLEARIASANGEFNEYANLLQIFNGFFGEFERWYDRTYIDVFDNE